MGLFASLDLSCLSHPGCQGPSYSAASSQARWALRGCLLKVRHVFLSRTGSLCFPSARGRPSPGETIQATMSCLLQHCLLECSFSAFPPTSGLFSRQPWCFARSACGQQIMPRLLRVLLGQQHPGASCTRELRGVLAPSIPFHLIPYRKVISS